MMVRVAILKNDTPDDHLEWVRACESHPDGIDYRIIDLSRADWYERVLEADVDCFLARPSGAVGYLKQLYDERLFTINKVLGRLIYPTYEECLVYENKRMLAYWLEAKGIPHPQTWIFYDQAEARAFADRCTLPVVGKTAIGAGGSGVEVLRSREALADYIRRGFGREGLSRRWGPNLRRGRVLSRLRNRLFSPRDAVAYFRTKRQRATVDPQKGYVILQQYVPSAHEWRCVRIGDSYFGHKKLRTRGELMSGTSAVSWDGPSRALLDFVKDATDRSGFWSQAVDIFEDPHGRFHVNEMQCFFGSRNPHQMVLDGVPGRYVRGSGRWIFEPGSFNTNNSHDLRLRHAIEIVTGSGQLVTG